MVLKLLGVFTAIGCFLFLSGELLAQNCVLTGLNNTSISSSCNQLCRDLSFQIPDIRSTSTYTVVNIPYNPYPYVTAGATEDPILYDDDKYSAVFNLPFPFCFYDSVYRKAVISSNGLVTFDTTYANCVTAAFIIDSTIPHPNALFKCALNDYPPASIMGAFMDLDPRLGSSPSDRKIEWRVEGTAPCRRFVVSYFHIGAFALTPCGQNPDSAATFQMVMYESTGLIDVFLQSKFCDALTGIRCVLGIQDFSRTRAVAAPGKNATVWTASKEGYRFVPSGGGSRFVSSELLAMDLSHIAFANSSSSAPGLLDISFPNICSPATSTQYIVKTIFSACDNPATQLTSMDTITINLTGSLNATATTTNTACGPPSGTITVDVPAGSKPPFSFVLDGGTAIISPAFTHTFTSIGQGPHTVIVTDGNNACTSTINIIVNQTNTLNATTSSTASACGTSNNGTITVTPANGSAPYTFSLDGGAPQAGPAPFTFINVAGGLHNVIVTDASNCVTNSIPVTVQTSISPTATVSGGTFCATGTTALTTTGATGGTFSASPAGLNISTATGVIDLAASTPNTYTITYSFGTAPCNGTATSQVTVSASPTATVSGGTFCATGTTTLTTTGATGGTFSASPAGLNINTTTGVIDLAASTPNTYTITYSFGTAPCNGTATSQVTVSASPTATVSGGTFCAAGTTILTTTGATGGTFAASPAGLNINTTTGVIDLAASTPNTYTITYSFGTAPCNGTATSQVTVSASPTATVSGGAFCATGTTTLTTTGATGGTFSASPAGLNINTTTGVIDLAASTPNTYTITYSFGTAPCNGTATSQVTVNASPTATVSGGTFCATGTTALTTTGATGGTFSASPAGLNISTATGVIDLAASTPNTYTITYSFGTAPCNGTATSQVTVSASPTATVSGGTFCATGTTTLTTTGATGGTFSASPAGLNINTTTGVIDLAASTPNTYTITYSFGTAPCNGTATSQVTVSASPTATVSGGTFCAAGTTILTTTGATGGTFAASPAGLNINTTTGVIDLAASTTNTYTITYSFGTAPCNGTATSQVTVSTSPTATVSGGTFCATGTTTLTTTGATGGTFSALPAGLNINTTTGVIDLAASTTNTYTITYSFGTVPCNGTATSQITIRAVLTTTVNKTDVLCNGGSTGTITVAQPTIGTAPYQYSLDGITWQDGNVFNGLVAGTYTVYYRESNGCQGSQPVIINEPAVLSVTASTFGVVCNGQNNGVITVNASGGVAPYQYSINGITYQTNNTFNVPAGTYTVFVKDNNGCINSTASIDVIEPPVLTISTTTQPASCNGGADGLITVTAGGGNSGYQYSIDGLNFQSSNSFNMKAGNYTVIVKDQNNCIITKNVTVGLNNNLTFSKGNDTTICEGGSAQLVAASNANVFVWTPATTLNNSSLPNPVASPTTTTEYTVSATLEGCNVSGKIRVIVNPTPIPNAGPDVDICFGQNARLSASGGTSYQWTPSTYLSSATIPDPTVIQPQQTTQYKLQVKDANGCTSLITDDVLVKITPPIKVTVSPKDSVVAEGDQIQLNATSIGTNYKWTNSFTLSNQNIPNPVAAMPVGSTGNIYTYTVTASTSAGCKGVASATLKVFKGPDIYVPTGFTPNGDGKNDRFYPITVGIKKINYFRVFNRWGQMVFFSSKLNDGWDGKLGDIQQPNGIYVWIVQAITRDDRVITKKGTVMLIR